MINFINLYTIYDSVAEECGPLFEAKNGSVAMRQFQELQKKINPEQLNDFSLYWVGRFDKENMVITNSDGPLEEKQMDLFNELKEEKKDV